MCLNDDFSENISRHLYLEYRVVALMLFTDYLYCVERYPGASFIDNWRDWDQDKTS